MTKFMNISAGTHHNPHGGGNTYELERALDLDMFSPQSAGRTATTPTMHMDPVAAATLTNGHHMEELSLSTRFGDGFYTEMVGRPLADDSRIAGLSGSRPRSGPTSTRRPNGCSAHSRTNTGSSEQS